MKKIAFTGFMLFIIGLGFFLIFIRESVFYEYQSSNLEMTVFEESAEEFHVLIHCKKKFLRVKDLDSIQTYNENNKRIITEVSGFSKQKSGWIFIYQKSSGFRNYFENYSRIGFRLYFSDKSSHYMVLHRKTEYRLREFGFVAH